MRSFVFAVVISVFALLTAVRSEMNSSFVDDGNLDRDGRDFFPNGNDPWVIQRGGNTAILKRRGLLNPNSVVQTSSEASNLTRSERAYVRNINSEKTVVFKKRGTVDSNSTAEPQRSERAYVNNINSVKTVVFKKRGTVDFNSTGEPHMSERAYVANINSEKTVVFKKRGTVDFNSTGESHMSERAVIGTFNSAHTDYVHPGGAVHINSTEVSPSFLSGMKQLSDAFNITETQSNFGGVPTIQRTVIFKKRGVIPPSRDMGKTGQFSGPAGSVNGSLST